MIDSPCIDICKIDPKGKFCVGCGRALDEIKNWPSYTEEKKKMVLKQLKARNNID